MKVWGLMVVQNEGDIIVDTLSYLRDLGVFEKIFFFDLGSEDDTLSKAEQFADILHEPQRLDQIYTEGLRFELLARHRRFFTDGDWLSIVDADEFYAEDPRRLIEIAESEGATCLQTYQAEFMLTDADLAALDREDPSRSIVGRRKHYLIQWSEDRFFKFLPESGFVSSARPCSRRLFNRHYQYRTPAQIDLRIRTRMANKIKARNLPSRQTWPQIFSRRWRDYVMPHEVLHVDDGGPLLLGLPAGVQWKDYYSKNPFSTIFPQIAETLERRSRLTPSPDAEGEDTGVIPVPPSTLLRDDYRARVVHELTADLRAGRWSQAGHALGVLMCHMIRWGRTIFRAAMRCKVQVILETLRSAAKAARRRVLGRPYGTLRARPNPIVRPQLSWRGATNLTWESGAARVEIRMGSPDGTIVTTTGRTGSMTTGPWIEDATTFFLQDASDGRPPTADNTLATLTVHLLQGSYVEAI